MKFLAVFMGFLFAAIQARRMTDSTSGKDFVQVITDAAQSAVDTVETAVESAGATITKVFGTKYDAIILSSAAQYGIDPDILYRLLYQESRFRDDIISGKTRSPVGALGIAQFMPATAAELGIDPLDPNQAIPGAARYLRKLYDMTGSMDAAVAAYNWGIGNVQRKGLASAPRETVNYVAAITGKNIRG